MYHSSYHLKEGSALSHYLLFFRGLKNVLVLNSERNFLCVASFRRHWEIDNVSNILLNTHCLPFDRQGSECQGLGIVFSSLKCYTDHRGLKQ